LPFRRLKTVLKISINDGLTERNTLAFNSIRSKIKRPRYRRRLILGLTKRPIDRSAHLH
jgi:hypothetical protein